jgi:beta-barrel assembly-enhancing protease
MDCVPNVARFLEAAVYKKYAYAIATISVLLFYVGCASNGNSLGRLNTQQMAAISEASARMQVAENIFTPEQEYYIGRAVAAQILSTRHVYENQKAMEYVNLIGTALAFNSDRPETFGGYHFLILDSEEINGFAAPGGLILVCRGLLRCASSEDGVAAILAQLISHVVLKDGLNAIKEARWAAAYRKLAMIAVDAAGSSEDKKLAQQLAQLESIDSLTADLMNRGYGRVLTLEADSMATVIMRRTGYDPRSLIGLLKAMKPKLAAAVPHAEPSPDERLEAVEKMLVGQPEMFTSGQFMDARQERFRNALGDI